MSSIRMELLESRIEQMGDLISMFADSYDHIPKLKNYYVQQAAFLDLLSARATYFSSHREAYNIVKQYAVQLFAISGQVASREYQEGRRKADQQYVDEKIEELRSLFMGFKTRMDEIEASVVGRPYPGMGPGVVWARFDPSNF